MTFSSPPAFSAIPRSYFASSFKLPTETVLVFKFAIFPSNYRRAVDLLPKALISSVNELFCFQYEVFGP